MYIYIYMYYVGHGPFTMTAPLKKSLPRHAAHTGGAD